jgi:hypothetical protein
MSHKSVKRLRLVVPILVAVTIVGYVTVKLSNRPSNGVITSPSIARPSKQSVFNLKPVEVSGSYVSFTYPAALSVSPNSKIAAPTVAMYNYSYRDIEPWKLAIDILNIPSGRLIDNNAYQFREVYPQTYSQSDIEINGTNVVIMEDKTSIGFSKVAFLVNGVYQATISLQGNDSGGTANLEATFLQVLNSWRWNSD